MPSSNTTNACTHVKVCGLNGTAAILVANISAGVAPEVNPRNKLHLGNRVPEQRAYSGFETQSRRHQKSKIISQKYLFEMFEQ